MGPRNVSRTPKKLNKKFNKTRSKKHKGSGIAPSKPEDPNKVDDYLRLALEEGSSESVGKYLNENADPNMTINDPDEDKDVPAIIYAARHNKSSGIIENLLKAGANVEQEPYYISTPLIEAAQSGNFQAVRVLLDNKANINAKTRLGTHPIAYAILNEDINMIKLMLAKRKGEINVKDIEHELNEYPPSNPEIITILKQYIANQTNQSSSGRKRTRKYKKSNNKTLKK
jgi:ankyrin repeat protein